MFRLLAAQVNLQNITGVGPFGNFNRSNTTAVLGLTDQLISIILALLTSLAGLYFMFQLILAGYNYISAGGEKAQVQTAQKKLTNSFLGLTIVVLAYVITGIIGRFMGLDIMRFSAHLYIFSP
jgi:hypothetical protein